MKEEIARLLSTTGMGFEEIASKMECSISEVANVDAELYLYINDKR